MKGGEISMENDFLKEIERIISKNFINLSNEEIAFLKARFDYLNDDEKKQFNRFLEFSERTADNMSEEKINDLLEKKIDKRTKAYKKLKLKMEGGA